VAVVRKAERNTGSQKSDSPEQLTDDTTRYNIRIDRRRKSVLIADKYMGRGVRLQERKCLDGNMIKESEKGALTPFPTFLTGGGGRARVGRACSAFF